MNTPIVNLTFANNSKLIKFGSMSLENCTNLIYTTYNKGNYLGSIDNPYLILVSAISPVNFTIADTTRILYRECFSNCVSMQSLIIPSSVTHIGSYAFMYYSQHTGYHDFSIRSITFEENSNLLIIDTGAFQHCRYLTTFTIPKTVK